MLNNSYKSYLTLNIAYYFIAKSLGIVAFASKNIKMYWTQSYILHIYCILMQELIQRHLLFPTIPTSFC